MRCPSRYVYATMLAGLALAACGEAPTAPADPPSTFVVVVSEPVLPMAAMMAPGTSLSGLAARVTAAGAVAFVSVASGTAPTATSAIIANRRTGETVPAPVVDGGFDPVGIAAETGDTLEVSIVISNGAIAYAKSIVPASRRPRVVRTSPIAGRTDIALSAIVGVIFSEPINPATLDITTVRLLRGGVVVAGTVRPMAGSSVGVEFVPSVPLAPATAYQLVLADRIMDLSGSILEGPAMTAFTTIAADQAPPVPPPPGSHLVFTAQPADRTAWLRFDAPPVVVTARTPLGATDQSFNGQVSLRLVDPFNGASLLDPVTGYALIERRVVAAVNGVATFEWVGVAGDGGTGYTLIASAAGFDSAVSAQFDVAPNPACNGCWDYSVAPTGPRSVP